MDEFSFVVDRRLRIQTWGEGIARLTGRKPEDVLGKRYSSTFPVISSNGNDALLKVIEKKKKVVLRGYTFLCPFSSAAADVVLEPVRASAELTGVRVVLSNVTPCMAAHDAGNSKRLIDIGKAASALAHGVRNPLNAIKGAVVYLSERFSNEPALVEFTQIIREEISRLDHFISHFLSTSLSDAATTEADLNALMKKIEVYTSLQARAQNIETSYEYGDVCPVKINSFHIEQAILNVINNAIEAMRMGGRLGIRTYPDGSGGSSLSVIEISDTGPGIPEAKLNDLSVRIGGAGRGFGLFLTREIFQYYGGEVDIQSQQGEGTVVRLCLPSNNCRGARA